jgi:class 3 adenylate cyclase
LPIDQKWRLNFLLPIVNRYGGNVPQYLGDEVLVYFGHPVAHEDDAQLAVRTALAIQTGVKNLSHSFRQEAGSELSVRMGIHTGEVIVGHDRLAVGEIPNVVARAQSLADPDTIEMTAETHHLVEPFFTCKHLGVYSPIEAEIQCRLQNTLASM